VAAGEPLPEVPGSDAHPAVGDAGLYRWRGPGGLSLGDMLFALASVVSVGVILYLGRYTTFFNDEWTFIVQRSDLTFDALMRPHNEHWSLMPVLVYNALLSTVGLRSYLPYLLALMLTHVAAASAVYVLLRYHNGPLPALAGGTLMLFLGTGEDNLFWAFQMAFLGAAAAGAWAIVLLLTRRSRRSPTVAAALLVLAVATSGTGLFFLIATAVMLALDQARRRRLWVVAPAAVAYLAWYVVFGSSAIAAHPDLLTLASLQQVPTFVVAGTAYAIGKLTGWGEQVGVVVFVALGFATAWHLSGAGRYRAAAVAGFVGLVAQFVLIGLVRVHLGVVQATSSRYVHAAALLLLIAAAGWIGLRFAELRVRPLAVLAVVFAIALGTNLSALPVGRDAYRQRADATRAAIMVIDRYAGSPAVPVEAGLSPIPAKDRLDEIRDRFGLPLTDALLPDAPPPHPSMVDAQLYALVADDFAVTTAQQMPASVIEPTMATSADVAVSVVSRCIELRAAGADPQVVLRVAGGSALAIEREQFGEAQAYLGLNAPPAETSSRVLELAPDTVYLLSVPDINELRPWTVRFDPPADAQTTRICIVAGADGSTPRVFRVATVPFRAAP
jgi:hypothetical protein